MFLTSIFCKYSLYGWLRVRVEYKVLASVNILFAADSPGSAGSTDPQILDTVGQAYMTDPHYFGWLSNLDEIFCSTFNQ